MAVTLRRGGSRNIWLHRGGLLDILVVLVHITEWTIGWAQSLRVHPSHPNRQGREVCLGATVFGIFVRIVGRVHS